MDENSLIAAGGSSLSSVLDNPEFLAALYAADSGLSADGMPVLFESDAFLVGVEVAGTRYRENMPSLFENLELGERLSLFREPTNEHDERAISVRTQSGEMLGYVPRCYNLILSRLMDAGYSLYALVRDKEILNGPYYKIVIKIYLAGGIRNAASFTDETTDEEIQALRQSARLDLLRTGLQANRDKKYRLSAEALVRFLESDTPEILYKQAVKYYNGIEGEKNYKEAAYWALKAADSGYDKAYALLFLTCFSGGYSLDKDSEKALYYAKKGADKGIVRCQYFLGILFLNGKIVDENIEMALYWLTKAAKNESFSANVALAKFYDDNKYGMADQEKAFQYAKAAYITSSLSNDDHDEDNLMNILDYLGTRLYQEITLESSYDQAFFYFKKAAEKGKASSQFYLGLMYLTGDECEKNEKTAWEWIDRAAEQDYEDAVRTRKNGYVLPDDIAEKVNDRLRSLLRLY